MLITFIDLNVSNLKTKIKIMFRIKKSTDKDFGIFKRGVIYNNIIMCFKISLFITAILILVIDYLLLEKINLNNMNALICLNFVFLVCILIIKYEIIENFEDWAGLFICFSLTFLYLILSIEYGIYLDENLFFFKKAQLASTFVYTRLFVQDFKKEVAVGVYESVIALAFQKYFQQRYISLGDILDHAITIGYFISHSHLKSLINEHFYNTIIRTSQKTHENIAKGFELLSQKLIILKVTEENELHPFYISKNLLENKDDISKNNKLIQFLQCIKRKLNYLNDKKEQKTVSLYTDVKDFCFKFKILSEGKQKSDQFFSSNYFEFKDNKEIKEFRIKFTYYKSPVLDGNSFFILISIEDKEDILNDFIRVNETQTNSVILSCVSNEMKIGINGIEAQVNCIKQIIKEEGNYKDNNIKETQFVFLDYLISKVKNSFFNIDYFVKINNNSLQLKTSIININLIFNKILLKNAHIISYNTGDIMIKDFSPLFAKTESNTMILILNNIISFLESQRSNNKIDLIIKINKDKQTIKIILEIKLLSLTTNSSSSDSTKNQNTINSMHENQLFSWNDLLIENIKNLVNYLGHKLKKQSREGRLTFSLKLDLFKINQNNNESILEEDESLMGVGFDILNNKTYSNTDIPANLDFEFEESSIQSPKFNINYNSNDINRQIEDNKPLLNFCNPSKTFQQLKTKHSLNDETINLLVGSCKCFEYLIVDDDSLCVSYIENVIKPYSNKIKMAINGLEAVNLVKDMTLCECSSQKQQIIIFMDFQMPIMNGIESSKQIDQAIKSNHNRSKILDCKIYIISGNIESQYLGDLTTLSVYTDKYNKPIKKKDLLNIINPEKNNNIR